jgi:hypothetical protein
MSKVDLVATRGYRYGGRALQAGDRFQASSRDARLLKAIRKASDPAGESEEAPAAMDDIDGLRIEYERLAGKAPDKRWAEKRLREEIEQHGRYLRRDMRAED